MNFAEILVIFLVALIVVGPKEIPRLAEKLGKLVGRWQRVSRDIQDQLDLELKKQQLNENIIKAELADELYYKQDRLKQ
jgi:sec-independent protein translocase protein TatB